MKVGFSPGEPLNWRQNKFQFASYLGEVRALCAPHGRCSHSQDDGGGDERVELRVELGGDVGGVAEHADHHGPLALEALDDGGGQEGAGDNQGGVDHRQGVGAEAVNLERKDHENNVYVHILGI